MKVKSNKIKQKESYKSYIKREQKRQNQALDKVQIKQKVKEQQLKMDKLQSPYHELDQPTYSSILNNAQKSFTPIKLYGHSPFDMIVTSENIYRRGYEFQQKEGQVKIASYRQFVREDLHRNPLAQSVDGGAQMQNSQVVSRCTVNPQNSCTYLAQYEVQQDTLKQEPYQDSPNTFNSNKSFKNVFSNQSPYKGSALQNQQNQKVSTFQSQIAYKIIDKNKNLPNQKQNKTFEIPIPSPSSQMFTSQLPFHNEHNQSLSHSANQQISQVKYRLDELMKRFAINDPKSVTGNEDWKKKQTPFVQNSAPQLNIKKAVSFHEDHSNGVLLNFAGEQTKNEKFSYNRSTPYTQMKIKIPSLVQEQSQYQPSSNNMNFQPESLNYSQSTKKNGSIHFQTQSDLQFLYLQIHKQQEVIATYKKIIFGLQNQNMRLTSLLAKFQNQNKPNPIQTKSMSFQKPQNKQKSQIPSFQQSQQFGKQNKQKVSDLQKKVMILESQKSQLMKKINWLNSVVNQMMCTNENTKMTSKSSQEKSVQKSNMISQHLTPKKGSQVKQVLNVKSQSHNKKLPQIIDNRILPQTHSKSINKSPYDPQLSSLLQQNGNISQLHKQMRVESIPVQTSFIDPITQNFDQFNYKRMYEKEIEYQQRMKQEMHELQMIQLAYDEQFRKVLEQIRDIKKNREYYQQLKMQIKKQKERSNSKGQNNQFINLQNIDQKRKNKNYNQSKQKSVQKNNNTSIYQQDDESFNNLYLSPQQQKLNDKTQSASVQKRIFQNRIIYHLKNQNQFLKENIHTLTKQLISRKPNQTHLATNQSHLPINQIAFKSTSYLAQSLPKNSYFFSQQINQRVNQNMMKAKSKYVNEVKQRPKSKISIVDKLKRRPKSFAQIGYFKDERNNSESKINEGKSSRKNGTISYLSSSSLSQIKNSSQLIRREFRNGDKTLNERIRDIQSFRIVEVKSSNCTQQSSRQVVVNRYNNFIKSMKKRFGINSQIIGSQIRKDNLHISEQRLQ